MVVLVLALAGMTMAGLIRRREHIEDCWGDLSLIASVKGHRIQRDKFILWATHHIGLSEREVSEAIRQLIVKNVIRLAATPGEMLLPPPK